MGIWDIEDSAVDLRGIKRECEISLLQVIRLRITSHFGLSSASPFSQISKALVGAKSFSMR